MELVNPLAEAYAAQYTTAEDALLQEVNAFTQAHHPKAHMLSGHLQGGLLRLVSQLLRPRRILEIGTFTGYSALCLAAGLDEAGVLHTIELRETDAQTAQGFFERSVFREKIKLHIGEALPMIDELDEAWDLVFIDADKANYVPYFNRVFPKLRVNGIILADNVLFHGQVLESPVMGKNAKAIQAFNDFIRGREDVEKLFLPVRDGLYLIRKLR